MLLLHDRRGRGPSVRWALTPLTLALIAACSLESEGLAPAIGDRVGAGSGGAALGGRPTAGAGGASRGGAPGGASAGGEAGGGDADGGTGGTDGGTGGSADGGTGATNCGDLICDENATCDDTGASPVCTCNTGFEGLGTACTDADECTSGRDDCVDPAICNNTPGAFTCDCPRGMLPDGNGCRLPTSCQELVPEGLGSGTFEIEPAGFAPLSVRCDFEADGNVGYTFVRLDDDSLNDAQADYEKLCASIGMEIVVPRTRAHMKAMTAHYGEPPNIVNIRATTDGAVGLDAFQGECGAAPCDTFYVSDNYSADCGGAEPNGNNSAGDRLIRYPYGDPTAPCGGYGAWDDNGDDVRVRGWVVCSPNDAGPDVTIPRESCGAWVATDTVWNDGRDGISHAYPISGAFGTDIDLWCEQRLARGGWRVGFVRNSAATGVSAQDIGVAPKDTAELNASPYATAASSTGVAAWANLNTAAYEELLVVGVQSSAALDRRPWIRLSTVPIPRTDLLIDWGQNGYYLWDSTSEGYTWCGGEKAFTDDGMNDDTPTDATPGRTAGNCKGNSQLGSGWDFSTTQNVNAGTLMTGPGDPLTVLRPCQSCTSVTYGNSGAALAVLLR